MMPYPKTLVVVEDDSIYADLISIVMENEGYEVRVARSLKDAFRLMDKGVTAITLDLHLPDAHGKDGLVALRKEWPNTPIIILSGHVSQHEFNDLVALGADACILKPPSVGALPLQVARAIKMRDCHGAIDELHRCNRALGVIELLCHV